jgi:hypothetical protein
VEEKMENVLTPILNHYLAEMDGTVMEEKMENVLISIVNHNLPPNPEPSSHLEKSITTEELSTINGV